MCKTDADCIKPATCKGGVCRDVAEAWVDETADTEPQVRIEPELQIQEQNACAAR